jgi:Cep192 domain 4
LDENAIGGCEVRTRCKWGAVNPDANEPNKVVEFTPSGQFAAQLSVDTSHGTRLALGPAVHVSGNQISIRCFGAAFLTCALLILVGCQGFSSGNSNSQTPPGALSLSSSTLSFGSVTVGKKQSITETLTNTGEAGLTISLIQISGAQFAMSGITAPMTLNAGQSANLSVSFSPSTPGTASGSISIASSAASTPVTIPLYGIGAAVVFGHSVNLSWNASTSSDISGYNIYRAVYKGGCGSYNKINAVLNTSTVYTDATVANGASYCYAATAVNTGNQESGYSNIASNVQIPAQ